MRPDLDKEVMVEPFKLVLRDAVCGNEAVIVALVDSGDISKHFMTLQS